ncbi:hypothetical protein FD967_10550 [Polynucleobacter sp. JS-Mosq-20-D10]|uniref:hypothetical protein n=1 Tax=Polynucleobacter sp. JS-Mosq-20-D10 TaxID=2576922 RepID=UPI001BFDD625|nr:hypothetical protein [Polynucleobacter sp. JS-Mosq-20-D10]QWE00448.1 hypothetical protein FD967_10550 [Polynucleobacter sp. JS-Mosq-20-D10]
MSARYAVILEQYQLNSILINIIRASNERPLSFLDIPSINGSGNVSFNTGLGPSMNGFIGGLAGGPLGISSFSPSLNPSFGNSFNFSQSSLDNATFLQGFLSQIPIGTAKFFISDNIPREVMFSLVVASIEIKQADGKSTRYINNPLLPEYPAFQAELYKLLSYGLTVDQVKEGPKKNSSPALGRTANYSQPNMPSPYQSPGGYGGSSGAYGAMYGQMQLQPQFKICVDENKFANFVKEEFSSDIFCKASLNAPKNKSSKSELILTIRSPNTVFEYLGQVVSAQNQENPFIVTLPPSATTQARKIGQENQYALLIVRKNDSSNKNFARVKNIDDDVHSIPANDNGYSPMVLKIISQLLSLNKVPGSIPASPGILLR